ncbi:hypothetical protein ALC53_07792 [Atta colombica]|uniref:Uncharacterized protein n=1 Tax=Atta colombica TaxID=520822 RepID=A0A195BB90_9HYME|nr:hypothetical protein ALC53_07792 [Atta colombica]
MKEEIYYIKTEDAIDSDHHPLIGAGEERGEGGEVKGKKHVEEFRKIGKRDIERMEWWEGNVHNGLKKVERRIKEVLENLEMERGKENKRYVVGCRKKKKKSEVRRVLKKWRKIRGEERSTGKKKESYVKELCEAKKKKENERWERKREKAKNEGQIWKIINKEEVERDK